MRGALTPALSQRERGKSSVRKQSRAPVLFCPLSLRERVRVRASPNLNPIQLPTPSWLGLKKLKETDKKI
jgi:hypothetical protein